MDNGFVMHMKGHKDLAIKFCGPVTKFHGVGDGSLCTTPIADVWGVRGVYYIVEEKCISELLRFQFCPIGRGRLDRDQGAIFTPSAACARRVLVLFLSTMLVPCGQLDDSSTGCLPSLPSLV